MATIFFQDPSASIPANVSSGDYTVTVTTLNCGNAAVNLAVDDSIDLSSGRYVLVRASVGLNQYAGANVTLPIGRTLLGVSREFVNYSGTQYDCIVATLA
jgi:hypothetical protein